MSNIPRYPIGEMRIHRHNFNPPLTINVRYQNDAGLIVIPGDKGDVIADFAEEDGGDIVLTGTVLCSYLAELEENPDNKDEIHNIARDIIFEAANSLGQDAFVPGKYSTYD